MLAIRIDDGQEDGRQCALFAVFLKGRRGKEHLVVGAGLSHVQGVAVAEGENGSQTAGHQRVIRRAGQHLIHVFRRIVQCLKGGEHLPERRRIKGQRLIGALVLRDVFRHDHLQIGIKAQIIAVVSGACKGKVILARLVPIPVKLHLQKFRHCFGNMIVSRGLQQIRTHGPGAGIEGDGKCKNLISMGNRLLKLRNHGSDALTQRRIGRKVPSIALVNQAPDIPGIRQHIDICRRIPALNGGDELRAADGEIVVDHQWDLRVVAHEGGNHVRVEPVTPYHQRRILLRLHRPGHRPQGQNQKPYKAFPHIQDLLSLCDGWVGYSATYAGFCA